MPRVTVAIPCFNHGEFLQETLDSVIAQTFDDYEIIVVNDGSTDGATLALLATLDYPKTRIFTTANRGVSAARNSAIAEALGEYVLPLDADDKIAPTYLEKAVAVLDQRPEVALVYTDQVLFGERQGLLSLPAYDRRRLLVENLIHTSAVFRRSLWENTGGYNEAMTRGWEDWDFWVAASGVNSTVVKLDEPLFHYRVRSSSRDNTMKLSSKLAMYGIMARRNRALYMKNWGYVLTRLCAHIVAGTKSA